MTQRAHLPAYIFRTYADSPFLTRLFILIRCWVCPFQAIIDELKQAGPLGSILDIGCGHGLFLHLLRLYLPGLAAYGTDHDANKIHIAQNSRPRGRITFLGNEGLEEKLPARVDCICLIDVLYSIPADQWSQILLFATQRLKSGGLLIVKETVNRPRIKYFICLIQEILAIRFLKYTKGQFPILPSVAYYLRQLSENGFEVISHRRLDRGYLWPHYLFSARKKAVVGTSENRYPGR